MSPSPLNTVEERMNLNKHTCEQDLTKMNVSPSNDQNGADELFMEQQMLIRHHLLVFVQTSLELSRVHVKEIKSCMFLLSCVNNQPCYIFRTVSLLLQFKLICFKQLAFHGP